MDMIKIQSQVRRLPARERKKLTAWMVAEYPVLSVERLLARAERAVNAGTLIPAPLTPDNIPRGRTVAHALAMAEQLGLRR